MKPLPLRAQLTLVYSVILALLVSALSMVYYHALALQLDADASAELADRTRAMHAYLRIADGETSLVFDANDADEVAFIQTASRYYQVYDETDGRLLVQSPALQPLGLRYTPDEVRAFYARPRETDIETDRGGRIRFSNSVITAATGQVCLLQVGVSLDGVDAALNRLLRLMLWSGPASLLIVVFTGRWMARRSLAPLGRLAAEARAIDVSELDRRLPVRGAGDELDEVAVAFNDTLKRLERSVGEMKQWSAAMAHELRTPLAALRGETELALAETGSPERIEQRLVSQLEELDRLTRLVNQLLTLANAEAGEISLAHERVDLPALVRSVVDQLVPMADARDVSLVCGQLEPATVRGDRGWLERLLLNLLDNAIKFNRCSGSIDVSLRSTTSETRLEVTDTGVGIDEAALPHLFEPFYRADPSRSSRVEGAGVGLALAKWIVERHGGRIEVDSAVGHGSHFTVTLPIDRET